MELLAFLKLIILVGMGWVYTVAFFFGKVKAREFRQEMSQYGFRLPFLAPLGFFLAEKIPPGFFPYLNESNTMAKIAQLFPRNRTIRLYKVHMAQKMTLTTTLLLFFVTLYIISSARVPLLLFGITLSCIAAYWVEKDLEKRIKIRKRQLLIDLSQVENTLALLLNAGLPFSSALQKVAQDGDFDRPLYQELNHLLADLNSGSQYNQAYEEFAYRCKVPEITRFTSTILQNFQRGNGDLALVLRRLAQEGWAKRKDIARRHGEEASAKLVFPMAMVFLAVAIIVLAPAIMTINR